MNNAIRHVVLFACIACCACGGQLYKVAVPPKLAPPFLASDANGLNAAARALTGDEALGQFDANLLLAGIVAVDVQLANRAQTPAQLAAFNWQLQDSANTLFKPLLPKQALKRVMRHYGNTLYLRAGYAETLANYETLALPLTVTLAAQQELRGFLFFESKYEATGSTGLTLTGNLAGQPLRLKLN